MVTDNLVRPSSTHHGLILTQLDLSHVDHLVNKFNLVYLLASQTNFNSDSAQISELLVS